MAAQAAALVALLAVLAVTTHSVAGAEPANDTSTGGRRELVGYGDGWLRAKATWYGAPNGAGPDDNGGACGFKNANQYPFMSMTSCGNQPLFMDGLGCGSCYQIMCTTQNNPACSGVPQTVKITDMNYYPVAQYHFDLSGYAFGSLASYGRNSQLRSAGIIDIQFRRVPCNYQWLPVTFHVMDGSNPNYLAVLVEYVNRDGTVAQMDLMEGNSGYWRSLKRSWGSVWRLDSYTPLKGPFTARIRTESGMTLVAYNVIPQYWRPNTDYHSNVQFN